MNSSDILIIGGGVIGLSIARELALTVDSSIILLEKGRTGKESSWAAGGMLAADVETLQFDDFYELCSASNKMYPQLAADLLAETGIDIELDLTGTLLAAFSDEDERELGSRYKWQKAAGSRVEILTAEEIKGIEPFISENVRGGLFYPDDGQVENRKLLEALKISAEQLGVEIIEGTEITHLITDEKDRVNGAATGESKFFAGNVILANGAWASNIKCGDEDVLGEMNISPVKGQMICFEGSAGDVKNVIYSPRGYLIPRFDGRILSGSTMENSGFDRTVTLEAKEILLKNAAEISPAMNDRNIAGHWSGLRPMAADGLPVLGPVGKYKGLTLACGHFRNGILLAPITARLISEYIGTGERSKYFETFAAERFSNVKKASIK